ncbi:MAG: sigma-70 family RNA polymerase sigma factor [Opitutaceae bacterium]|nr:sigma-70 family RNA polymerase sigma factor [Cephaloticoccus sp.]MCP5531007.1 sigma-70 family RNA polymerase sigma factor [Opitutaceae bacterium]
MISFPIPTLADRQIDGQKLANEKLPSDTGIRWNRGMPRSADEVVLELNAHHVAFKAFIASRVGSGTDAEDILQNGLAKAFRVADTLHDDGKALPWFYQLLRNAIIDHHRARGSSIRRDTAFGELLTALEETVEPPVGWEAQLCGCLEGVIGNLPSPQNELLRRVDLQGESVQIAAEALDITPNHASVILHRARKNLRARLETFCGDCAETACLDCDCTNSDPDL